MSNTLANSDFDDLKNDTIELIMKFVAPYDVIIHLKMIGAVAGAIRTVLSARRFAVAVLSFLLFLPRSSVPWADSFAGCMATNIRIQREPKWHNGNVCNLIMYISDID